MIVKGGSDSTRNQRVFSRNLPTVGPHGLNVTVQSLALGRELLCHRIVMQAPNAVDQDDRPTVEADVASGDVGR
jgi:hypothetical protein